MSMLKAELRAFVALPLWLLAAFPVGAVPQGQPNAASGPDYGVGSPETASDMRAWDIIVGPKGGNLPPGEGTVAEGKVLYARQCASCHGADGQGGIGPRLAGGIGSLASAHPVKDVGSYWPFATTLFDYIRRAMPFDHPESLSADQVYAASAYILYLNRLAPPDAVMDRASLSKIEMPNRNGFIWRSDPDTAAHD
ncbi:MAG TPA: cytochrome c [Acidocella sp.]|uniref:c-type cytochrome n=1 Tax=Acidocella sp. TaxID=50710 RepID=UPI002CA38292|nr:cytochrome c [Acidocella sp.]HVE21158.1 cytochrome c [Acidocella sp.]